MTKRRWFQLHSYTGVITGLMLFVICWSGTFAVVSHEIDWLVTPEARVEARSDHRSWGEIYETVKAAVPGATIKSLNAPQYATSAVTVIVTFPEQKQVRVYIDPHTGEIQGQTSYFTVQRFFRDFHRKLFVPGVGRYVILVFSLMLVTSLVTALVFYKRWWLGFLRLPRLRGRLFWSEVHKFIGTWSIWFLVIIGITSIWYLYEMGQRDLLGGNINYIGGEVQVPTPTSDPALPAMPLDDVVGKALEVWPDFEVRKIVLKPSSARLKTVYIEGQRGFPLVRDRANQMHLDPRTGEILLHSAHNDLSAYWLWLDMADPIHFGRFGGLWSKAVWFVFGLTLSGLILTGTWLHVRRLAREADAGTRLASSAACPIASPAAIAAVVTSVGVLALSVPFGLAGARRYGPLVGDVRHFPDISPGVMAFIFGWIAVTVLIIAIWAALLWWPRILRPAP